MGAILGLNTNNGGTSAALIINGKIIAAVEEERFVRIKNTWGFPNNAINYCLKKARISLSDIDYFAVPSSSINRFGKLYEKYLSGLKDLPKEKIRLYPHHICHAAGSFYCSGFKKADILIMDAIGDDECISYFKATNNKINLVWRIPLREVIMHCPKSHSKNGYCSSPGDQYSQITQKLNFGEFGEGKTMAYSVLGKKDKKIKRIFWFDKDFKLHIDESWKTLHLSGEQFKKNLAFRLQKDLSRLVNDILDNMPDKTGFLCLGGGCFLNCSINGEIYKRKDTQRLFIQPNARDSGNSLGAALYCCFDQENIGSIEFDNALLGPKFSNQEIKEEIERFNLKYQKLENPSKEAAKLIKKDYIIGWFQGKMEWGPRALGNRSILANPDSNKVKDRLNHIKGRKEWRPFGLSMLQSDFQKYFRNRSANKFMVVAYDIKGKVKNLIQGGIHKDNTSRIQVVSGEDNKKFSDLLHYFKEESGIGAVINTSFNSKGSPIVCSPKDAIISFLRMDLDYLIIGNYLIFKEKKEEPYKNKIEEVMIEITNRCHLDCPCCSYENKNSVIKQDMSIKKFKQIIKDIKDINKGNLPLINFSGLGEPLANKNFKEIIRLLKKDKIKYRLDTNGLLMEEHVTKAVLSSDIKEINISLDGINSESYLKYRKNGDFNKIIKNTKFLIKRKRELKSDVIIILQLLVMSHTENDIQAFIEQGKKLGADIVKLKSIFINNKRYIGLLPKHNKQFSRYFKYPLLIKKTHKCQWVGKKVLINSNGTVMPCCFAEHRKEYVLGNIFNENLKDILMKEKSIKLFNKIKNDINSVPLCKNCHQDVLSITSKDISLNKNVQITKFGKIIGDYEVYRDNSLLLDNRNEFYWEIQKEVRLPLFANVKNKIKGAPLCLIRGYEGYLQLPKSLEFKFICQKGKLSELFGRKVKYKKCQKCKYFFVCFGVSPKVNIDVINPTSTTNTIAKV